MLFPLQYDEIIINALREDLGRAGDITSNLTVPAEARGEALIVARQAGCICGLEVARRVFFHLDPALAVEALARDGQRVGAGTPLLRLQGSARSVLAGERTALNFLGRLSGISQATALGVDRLRGSQAHLVATRKTTPGLRMLEKYAVVTGGGESHRFGLDDGVLIEDNHVALAGGVVEALRRVQEGAHHLLKVELEVDTLQQFREVLALVQQHQLRLDALMLDNFSCADMKQAVGEAAGRVLLEASGGITLDRLAEVAATGVDLISLGSLTHSVTNFDVALDVVEQPLATAR